MQPNVPIRVGYVIADSANQNQASEEFTYSYASQANKEALERIDETTDGPQTGFLTYWLPNDATVINPGLECAAWMSAQVVDEVDVSNVRAHFICPANLEMLTQQWKADETFDTDSGNEVRGLFLLFSRYYGWIHYT